MTRQTEALPPQALELRDPRPEALLHVPGGGFEALLPLGQQALQLPQHLKAQAEGSRGKPREAEGSRGKPREAEGSRGKPREAEGSRGKPREAEGSRGKPKEASSGREVDRLLKRGIVGGVVHLGAMASSRVDWEWQPLSTLRQWLPHVGSG